MSESAIKNRILEFCDAKGISIRNFEIQSKLSNGYVSSMRKGIGTEKLYSILSAFPDLNRNWLLFGEGEMVRVADAKSSIDEEKERLWSLIQSLNEQLKTKDAHINSLLDIIQKLKSE